MLRAPSELPFKVRTMAHTTPTDQAKRGYWLVRESDNSRFYVSLTVNEPSLDRVCNRVLSDKSGYGYWIDYCLGLDVKGAIAWMNLDYTDSFI